MIGLERILLICVRTVGRPAAAGTEEMRCGRGQQFPVLGEREGCPAAGAGIDRFPVVIHPAHPGRFCGSAGRIPRCG